MADRCLLYYITDRCQFRGDESARRRALLAKVAEAARAGIDYIQLREKDLSTRELEQLASEVAHVVRRALRTENRNLRTRLLNQFPHRRCDCRREPTASICAPMTLPPAKCEASGRKCSLAARQPVARNTSSSPPPATLPPRSSAPNLRLSTSPFSLRYSERDERLEPNPPASPPCAKPAGRRSRCLLWAASPWRTPHPA